MTEIEISAGNMRKMAPYYCLCSFISVCVLWNSQIVLGLSEPSSTVSQKDQAEVAQLFISEHCRTMFLNMIIDKDYVYLHEQALLYAHPLSLKMNSLTYIKEDFCVATFAAPAGYQLLLHLIDVAIDYRPQYKSRLYIYDGFNAEMNRSPLSGLFGETKSAADTFTNVKTRDYLSSYQALTLVFSGYLSQRFFGFKALLTPVKNNLSNGTCPLGMLSCVKNMYCIDRSLACNGLPNCGENDNSDENELCASNQQYMITHANLDDLGLMIGCGVSILVLLLAVIWVAILVQKRHRLRQERYRLREATQLRNEMSLCQTATSSPMWFPYHIPRGLYQWIYPDCPPPAYTEHADMEPPANAGPVNPPPYMPRDADASQNSVNVPTNIIINPMTTDLSANSPQYLEIDEQCHETPQVLIVHNKPDGPEDAWLQNKPEE